ncbi:hypothetical protein [Cellulomonas soli]|uniref:Uncharacterized protein n=1 Tax=Cellulomonas soli TaxID=931535 RepID=A0A512PGR9_9CELL|nr:hypothetical protein [Cellulomonas soli]GEP70398.1 hypothetical protein CSO01_31130 [Cellulomonas soli]
MGVVPDRTAIIRLAGAVLAEQHDGAEGRRHLALDVLGRSRPTALPDERQEVNPPQLPALSA